jgi:hypothetical protein
MTIEKLTEEERARLARMYQTTLGRKALRCLDAALARAEAAERVVDSLADRVNRLRKDCPEGWVAVEPIQFERYRRAESEAAELRARLEAAERKSQTVEEREEANNA